MWLLSCSLLVVGCGELPSVIIEPQGATVTDENGASVNVTVSLAERPNGLVVIRAVSSDESEAQVSEAVSFDRVRWRTPRTITVRGVGDGESDGDVPYEVTFEISGVQGEPVELETLSFVNRDRERATFEALGDLAGGAIESYVTDVSASGDVVAGYSAAEDGHHGVRWTPSGGLTALAGGPSIANDVSPDGTLFTGHTTVRVDGTSWSVGVLWRADEPYQVLDPIEPAPTSKLRWFAEGTVVLDDGRVFGRCQYRNSYGEPVQCRVIPTPLSITETSPSQTGSIHDADASDTYVGVLTPVHGMSSLFRTLPMRNGVRLPFPVDAGCGDVPATCSGTAFALASGTIVGVAQVPEGSPERAFVSDPDMTLLPDLPGGLETGSAYAISRDGRVIGGRGDGGSGLEAVLWLDGKPHAVSALIAQHGGSFPEGFAMLEVRGLSHDGRTLVGNGRNMAGNAEGFRVVLPSLPE